MVSGAGPAPSSALREGRSLRGGRQGRPLPGRREGMPRPGRLARNPDTARTPHRTRAPTPKGPGPCPRSTSGSSAIGKHGRAPFTCLLCPDRWESRRIGRHPVPRGCHREPGTSTHPPPVQDPTSLVTRFGLDANSHERGRAKSRSRRPGSGGRPVGRRRDGRRDRAEPFSNGIHTIAVYRPDESTLSLGPRGWDRRSALPEQALLVSPVKG